MKLFTIFSLTTTYAVVAFPTISLATDDLILSGRSVLGTRELSNELRILPRTPGQGWSKKSAGGPDQGSSKDNQVEGHPLGQGPPGIRIGRSATFPPPSFAARPVPGGPQAGTSRDTARTAQQALNPVDSAEREAATFRTRFHAIRRERKATTSTFVDAEGLPVSPKTRLKTQLKLLNDDRSVPKAKLDQAEAYERAAVAARKAGNWQRRSRNLQKATASQAIGDYLHAKIDRQEAEVRSVYADQMAELRGKAELEQEQRANRLRAQSRRFRKDLGGQDTASESESESESLQ